MRLLTSSGAAHVATCSRCAKPYTGRSLIVSSRAGGGPVLCPACAARTGGSQGRRLARLAHLEIRTAGDTPRPRLVSWDGPTGRPVPPPADQPQPTRSRGWTWSPTLHRYIEH
jgi:hypothetical protein